MMRLLRYTLSSSRTVTIGFVAMLCAAIFLCAEPTQAQSVSGSISGNVVDASKQVVPGALVTLVDEQTGTTRTTSSGDGGRFVFSAVQPGRYTVRVELAGFSTAERTAITLPASEQLSLGTIELQIGGLTETITATAETTLVQTESSVRSAALTSSQLESPGGAGPRCHLDAAGVARRLCHRSKRSRRWKFGDDDAQYQRRPQYLEYRHGGRCGR